MKPIIELRNITKTFDDEKVVDNINLVIGENEFITLLGPSGCGKTTILRMIAGFVSPDEGDIVLNGEVVNDLAPYERPINTVFQRYALFPHLNVFDNIAFGLRNFNRQLIEISSSVRKSYESEKNGLLKKLQKEKLSKEEKQECKYRLREIKQEIKRKIQIEKDRLIEEKFQTIEKRYSKRIADLEEKITKEEEHIDTLVPDAKIKRDELWDKIDDEIKLKPRQKQKILKKYKKDLDKLNDIINYESVYKLKKELRDVYKMKAEEERKAPSLMMSKHHIIEAVTEALKMVGLSGYETRKVTQLSGGQQQRVAIARAIVNKPKILLLDEPLAALDLKLRQNMQYELKEMQRNLGITFIFVTHDQEEALTMSDRVVVMDKGVIQQIGTPEDIYNEPVNKFVASFIGESNIFEGTYLGNKKVKFLNEVFECVDTNFEEGERVNVVIRPEDFDIVGLDKAKIKAVVDISTFKGVFFEICVLHNQKEIIIHKYENPEAGSTIGLAVDPYEIHLMRNEDGEV